MYLIYWSLNGSVESALNELNYIIFYDLTFKTAKHKIILGDINIDLHKLLKNKEDY